MSEQPKARPQIPDGDTRYLKTRQMAANDKGFVGYETIWESFQKVAQYSTPKRP